MFIFNEREDNLMAASNKPQIKYYPVRNGDMSLITLADKTTIIVDCNIKASSKDGSDKTLFDVKKDLLNSIQKRNNIPYVDVFILTHGDQDHCLGFKDNFYQGDPTKYSDKHRKEDLIIMDAMWFSPMIAEQYTNDDEDAYQQEAERRLALHRKKDANRDLPGNRIKIIGYDGSKKYDDLDHLRATPGTIVSRFNDKDQKLFSIFIHAPFKTHLDSPDKDKNSASIVFQARFKENEWKTEYSCQAMFGGDSDHTTWVEILDKTKRYKNDVTEKALNWDLFLAPHHCSWTFFNDTPQNENPTPKDTSLEVLDYSNTSAYVIASSKKIVNNDDNPPHYQAKQQYIKKLNSSSKFLNTSEGEKGSGDQPIVFDITPNGPALPPKAKVSGSSTAAGGTGAPATIISQG